MKTIVEILNLILMFSIIGFSNKIKAASQTSHWNEANKAALGYYLSGQYDQFYSSLFQLIVNPNEQTLARQIAEENISAAYQMGLVPKFSTVPAARVIDTIMMVSSINREFGFSINYSLAFEIQSHQLNSLTSLKLSRGLQPILSIKGEKFSKITDLHKIWFTRYTGLQEPLQEGAYVLTIEYDKSVDQFYFFINDFGKISELPQFPKITKGEKLQRIINWTNFRSSSFKEERDEQKIILTTTKNNEKKAKWHEERKPSSLNHVNIEVTPEEESQLYFGISYLEIHNWGQIKYINTVNYRQPILTK